ncbi:MAG: PAS domain S-box protein, partial [Methanomicrobiales archaeon]
YLQKGGDPTAQFVELTHKVKKAVEGIRAGETIRTSYDRFTKSEAILNINQVEIDTQAEELRRANLELVESRDKYLDLYDFAPLGYLTLSDKARITNVNLTGATLLGVERGKLLSAPFSKFVAEKDIDPWHRYFRNVEGREEKQVCTLMLIRADGSNFPARMEGVRTTGSDGAIAVRIAITDISDIMDAEDALRESEGIFNEFLIHSPVHVYIKDEKLRLIKLSESFLELLGKPISELIGKDSYDLLPPDFAEHAMADDLKVLQESTEVINEEQLGHKTYTTIKFPIHRAGKPDYLGGFSIDITGRKKAEEALREVNEYLQNLLDYANAPIIVWDPNFMITRFNHAFEDLTLISEQEVIGQHLDILFPKESRDSSLLQIKKTLLGEQWETVEIPILVKDGSVRTVIWNSANILDPYGRVISTIAQGVDITDRKRAAAALSESFTTFRTVMDSLDALVYVADMKTYEILFLNQYGRKTWGDLTGKICWESLQSDQEGPCPFCTNEKLLDLEGDPAGILVWEFQNTTNGHWYECHDNAIQWIDGRTVRLEIAFDITGRKRVQEALAESESFNRGLVENLPDYIAVYGMDGKLLYVNPASAKTLGYDADTLIGTHVLSYIAEEYRETVIAKMTARTEGGEASPYEIEMVTRNGPRRSVIVKATPIQYQNNPAILLLLIDITERKLAEEARQKSEEKFRQLFMQMPSAVAIYEAEDGGNDFIFKDFNTAAEKIEGIKKEDLIGKRVSDIFPGVKKFGVFAVFQRVWRTGEPEFFPSAVYSDEHDVGTWRESWVYRLGSGEVIAIYNDITERMLGEKSLQQANRKLNLLSSITRHDILNLLTVLIAQMELIKRKQYDPSLDKHFNKIIDATERIHAIIQFTKTYESIGVHTPVWQDIRILVDKATEDAEPGKVQVNNDIPYGAEVFADPLVVKVFYNLMDNAVRYGGKITTIRFSALESDDDQLIVCEDDGDGVPQNEKEKIFERGFGKNTGLGLA